MRHASISSLPFPLREEDILLSSDEAAGYLRVTTRSLENWRRRGIGPRTVQIGGCLRYPLPGLRQYVQEGEASGKAA